MLVSSRMNRELVVGGEHGVHRPRKASLLEAEQEDVELGFEGDAEISVQQLEVWERVRLAAGQTC